MLTKTASNNYHKFSLNYKSTGYKPVRCTAYKKSAGKYLVLYMPNIIEWTCKSSKKEIKRKKYGEKNA